MFVALSKTLDLLVAPLTWAVVLVVAGLAARRRPALRAAALAAALLVLVAFSTGAVSSRLVGWLEASAEATWRPGTAYDVAVVLSGQVDDDAAALSGQLELTAAADRMIAAYDLLRRGGARVVLLSGGPIVPHAGEPTEPERVAQVLVGWGVDPARLVLETASRNTHENAAASARIVAERGWGSVLLVTSAAHMQRALGCFRRAGLAPDALPVDRRRRGRSTWIPKAEALAESTNALRELTGRLVYRLVGYT